MKKGSPSRVARLRRVRMFFALVVVAAAVAVTHAAAASTFPGSSNTGFTINNNIIPPAFGLPRQALLMMIDTRGGSQDELQSSTEDSDEQFNEEPRRQETTTNNIAATPQESVDQLLPSDELMEKDDTEEEVEEDDDILWEENEEESTRSHFVDAEAWFEEDDDDDDEQNEIEDLVDHVRSQVSMEDAEMVETYAESEASFHDAQEHLEEEEEEVEDLSMDGETVVIHSEFRLQDAEIVEAYPESPAPFHDAQEFMEDEEEENTILDADDFYETNVMENDEYEEEDYEEEEDLFLEQSNSVVQDESLQEQTMNGDGETHSFDGQVAWSEIPHTERPELSANTFVGSTSDNSIETEMAHHHSITDDDSAAFVDRMELADAYDEGETGLEELVDLGGGGEDDSARIPIQEESLVAPVEQLPVTNNEGETAVNELMGMGGDGDDDNDDGDHNDDVAANQSQEPSVGRDASAQNESQEEGDEMKQVHAVIDAATERILRKELKFRRREIKSMKPEIAFVVAEKRLRRPLEGMPANWYKPGSEGDAKIKLPDVVSGLSGLPGLVIPILLSIFAISGCLDVSELISSISSPRKSDSSKEAKAEASTEEPEPDDESKLTDSTNNISAASSTVVQSPKGTLSPFTGAKKPSEQIDETWLDKAITAIGRPISAFFKITI